MHRASRPMFIQHRPRHLRPQRAQGRQVRVSGWLISAQRPLRWGVVLVFMSVLCPPSAIAYSLTLTSLTSFTSFLTYLLTSLIYDPHRCANRGTGVAQMSHSRKPV